jgi:peptidoglycan/LPS O-acetylase OafA/YrhL
MLHEFSEQLERNQFLSWFSVATGLDRVLREKVESSLSPAGSQEQTRNFDQLQTQPATLRDPLSLLRGSFNFLFVPLPFTDNGSLFLNIQSFESFFWYIYYILLLVLVFGLMRGKYFVTVQTLTATLFVLGFILMSALVEINDGTSVRHRAVLLMGILVMLATFRSKETRRILDQESNL